MSDEEFKKYKEVLNAVGSGDLPKFEQKEEIAFSDAAKGDTVIDDYGTYTIKKVTEPSNPTHETGSITFSLNKVLLATFKPNEESASFFDREELKLAVMLIESENNSEDTVSFHPFSTTVTTNTKGQYDAQTLLNKGESEHIGQVTQEFRTAFNLEDENLDEIKEMTFILDKPSKDSMSFGEEVKIDVTFD
ncbi:hypothetical protein [Lentibacillus salicampi]|uniref:DUF4352 domain-containing protein n=1 Tax=Lentibacillus salicampi TaxID=175306 RepID=A0A4Y9A8I6_9BACI|nr:hypothetical protein [Lentibacillus salicampi]TFJ90652.1 hypothetical protein E4U82_19145 [Lentibacillus salicampi]